MSAVMLLLMFIGVIAVCGIGYGCYRLWRSGGIDDEAAERKRLADEAARADELDKMYPGVSAVQNKDRVKRFVKRT